MAYACPVCESLVPDGEHLAHHLAIVAMSRGGEHEAWLDDHAPGWRETGPDALASTATEHADELEHELVDETAGEHPDVDHAQAHGSHRPERAGDRGRGTPPSDEETASVVAEARELTRQLLEEDGDAEASNGGAADPDDATETDTDE